ncbi:hypothetical protein DQ04_07241000 [Trypanosoma grayi]|uniref:hypothetical protein n=1 Tax=Trypanosoma grayi TaxID=71804 RepID=UPI0004F4B982|nr:hypothetical protein DQ04_07241000 [Trypanosoma grayi]KEG08412.1 hypothetical protein DQ04_07241000 [Trypanosoma grayi]
MCDEDLFTISLGTFLNSRWFFLGSNGGVCGCNSSWEFGLVIVFFVWLGHIDIILLLGFNSSAEPVDLEQREARISQEAMEAHRQIMTQRNGVPTQAGQLEASRPRPESDFYCTSVPDR